MKVSIRLLGSIVAGGLLCVALGGAATSAFVLKALSTFSANWESFTANMQGEEIDALSSSVSFMQFLVLGGSIATISTLFFVGAFFMWFTNRKVVGPMLALTKTMDSLAKGDTSVDIPFLNSGDEIGVMASAVENMKENTLERIKLESHQKDLETQSEAKRREEMGKLAHAFEQDVDNISKTVADSAEGISDIGSKMNESVHHTKDKSVEVLSAAGHANDNVQNIATAAEKLSSSILEVTRTVNETAKTAKMCADQARDSQQQIHSLQAAVDEIDSVIQAINDIAEQTNLLALNATIEAARAGEAGKGFAVVASEVKNLASQTQNMTDNITEKVNSIKEIANRTTEGMNSVISQIEDVDAKANSVAQAMDSQNAATSEITQNIQLTAQETQNVSSGIQNIGTIADQSVAISASLENTSQALLAGSMKMEAVLESFLNKLRQ